MTEAPSTFLLLYGAPGVGKFTIATELSHLTGAILFDNHMSIEWALRIFPAPRLADVSEPFKRLRDRLREAVLSEIGAAGESVVMTFVYAHPGDLQRVEAMLSSFERHGGRALPIQLVCEQGEHQRPVQAPDRATRQKMRSIQQLQEMMSTLELATPIPHGDRLRLDVTNLSPVEAARDIAALAGMDRELALPACDSED